MDLHLIPGLGADGRLFDRLDLEGHTAKYHAWPAMSNRPSLQDLARALARDVDIAKPHVLIGVSMGGMVAQEMAAITRPLRVIIISSWKSSSEMPRKIKVLRGLHPERVLTDTMVRRVVPIVRVLRYTLGLEDRASQELGQQMLESFSASDLRAMMNAVMQWGGPAAPVENLVHIHGDKDRLMPLRLIKDPIVVRGGTHFMTFSKAVEVSAAIRRALES